VARQGVGGRRLRREEAEWRSGAESVMCGNGARGKAVAVGVEYAEPGRRCGVVTCVELPLADQTSKLVIVNVPYRRPERPDPTIQNKDAC